MHNNQFSEMRDYVLKTFGDKGVIAVGLLDDIQYTENMLAKYSDEEKYPVFEERENGKLVKTDIMTFLHQLMVRRTANIKTLMTLLQRNQVLTGEIVQDDPLGDYLKQLGTSTDGH